MKIALDLDGVVIDPHTIWFQRLSKKIGREIKFSEITDHRIADCLNISDEIVMGCYTPDIYLECPPEKGAIEGIEELNRISNGNLVIVSRTDPEFDDVKRLWLKKYFPNIKFDIRFSRSGEQKSKYLKDCHFFIDDYHENFSGVEIAFCLLFDKPWNHKIKVAERANGWHDLVQRIINFKTYSIPLDEDVKKLAYFYWLVDNKPQGKSKEHYYKAKNILKVYASTYGYISYINFIESIRSK